MQTNTTTLRTAKIPIFLSLVGLLGPACQPDDAGMEPAAWTSQAARGQAFDQDSILIKFRATPSAAALHDVLSRVGGKMQDADGDRRDDRFQHIAGGRLAQIELKGPFRAAEALARIANHPAIEYAEPNYIVTLDLTPNDPSFGSLWGLHNTGQSGGTVGADIDAVEAWDTTTGSAEIVVGVIDTGIDYNHPDLRDNMWVNPGEIPGNGIDDDGNGYIDDVYGINAITNSGNPMDDHNHGTHVAGTIGATGNNGVGVVGVNWNVSMIGMKFLSGSGSGTTADAIKCINYAVGLKQSGVNLRVLSNSWGGGGYSQALADSIAAANAEDIMFVAAAGNSSVNNDTSPHYPSNYDFPNVVSVASTDRYDALSSFSNYGANTVHLGAPGSAILSTTVGNTYATYSGTSMATPHVSGVAALLLAINHTLTTAELKDILMSSGDAIPALASKTISGKRLNAASALAQVGPPQPTFRLAASPASQTLSQGESTSFTVDITSVSDFADDVTLSVSSSPALDAAVIFTPNPAGPDSTSTLTIATTAATAVGTYALTITGESGDITKSRTVGLTVRPEGTVERSYTSSTPVSIPDNSPAGITSTISVTEPIQLSSVAVTVNITHTYIGDLVVKLTSPIGTEVTLHNRAGGSADNINQTYTVPAFNGENGYGAWTLSVSDLAGADIGTLDNWTVTLIGVPGGEPGNIPPQASFTVSSQGQTASFTDTSTDADGTIAAWSWSFGDGLSSTAQHPTHSYATHGTYNVTLTVTDDRGATSSTSQSVTVYPNGTVVRTYSNTTPVSIPDNTPAGITSTIVIPEPLSIIDLAVSVNITHTYIGDLIVRLTSPSGTVVTLHNRTGGSTRNLYQTYTPTQFNGQEAAGTWTLSVSDNASIDVGTLDSWSLAITGVSGDGNVSPTASFSADVSGLSVAFTDTSVDPDGAITAWSWSFGDGTTSSAQHPSHTYAAGGTYTVTLTVTDDAGATSTTSQSITVSAPVNIELSVSSAVKRGNEYRVTLDWSGATTGNVELYRDGWLVTVTPNDGTHLDRFPASGTTFVYVVCNEGGPACSNEVTVTF